MELQVHCPFSNSMSQNRVMYYATCTMYILKWKYGTAGGGMVEAKMGRYI